MKHKNTIDINTNARRGLKKKLKENMPILKKDRTTYGKDLIILSPTSIPTSKKKV